jgi:citrate synthase
MGFGHRVYKKVMDPRTIELKKLSKKLAEEKDPKWFEISEAIAEAVYKYKGLLPNVDFYSASVYANLSIPDDLFINMFALSRISGWSAHIIEQYENNKLIRPRALYTGAPSREYKSFGGRK